MLASSDMPTGALQPLPTVEALMARIAMCLDAAIDPGAELAQAPQMDSGPGVESSARRIS